MEVTLHDVMITSHPEGEFQDKAWYQVIVQGATGADVRVSCTRDEHKQLKRGATGTMLTEMRKTQNGYKFRYMSFQQA